jgi:D-Tyr-tRNAtyr deacylase
MLRKAYDHTKVKTGQFQSLMEVGSIVNGPVNIQYEKLADTKPAKK